MLTGETHSPGPHRTTPSMQRKIYYIFRHVSLPIVHPGVRAQNNRTIKKEKAKEINFVLYRDRVALRKSSIAHYSIVQNHYTKNRQRIQVAIIAYS